MGDSGLYSIVKFVEDLDRREPKNVAVVLATADGLVPKFVERDDLGANSEVVQRFEGLLMHLVRDLTRGSGVDPFTALRDLASRQFSHFQIDEPRLVVLTDEPDALLDRLTDRLVVTHAQRLLHS